MPVPIRTAGPLAAALVRRPRLWRTAFVQARALTPSGWWRRRPFLPVPAPEYLAMRSVMQYGDPAHTPDVDDVVAYLEWARQWRAASV